MFIVTKSNEKVRYYMDSEERPIVFTITQNDTIHYRIYTKDSRTDIQANAGLDGLFDELICISEELNKQGYAVLFEVD